MRMSSSTQQRRPRFAPCRNAAALEKGSEHPLAAAIEAANSGHPGTPIGIAPVTYTLWQRYLRFDPADPIWPNRDRFVISAGHASALLWSLLHLNGVRAVDPEYEILGEPAVVLDDLKRFRHLGSKCPGHPEYRWTSGVETTT